jgi:hypothetical protein
MSMLFESSYFTNGFSAGFHGFLQFSLLNSRLATENRCKGAESTVGRSLFIDKHNKKPMILLRSPVVGKNRFCMSSLLFFLFLSFLSPTAPTSKLCSIFRAEFLRKGNGKVKVKVKVKAKAKVKVKVKAKVKVKVKERKK